MIDMLQQPRVQTGNGPKHTSTADPIRHDSAGTGSAETSFDQHLDQQIRRSPEPEPKPANTEKTHVKQASGETEAEQIVIEDPVDDASLSGVVDADARVAMDESLLQLVEDDALQAADAEGTGGAAVDVALTEQTLPQEGKTLPSDILPLMAAASDATDQPAEPVPASASLQTAKPVIMDVGVTRQQAAVVAASAPSVSPDLAMKTDPALAGGEDIKLPDMKVLEAQVQNAQSQTGQSQNAQSQTGQSQNAQINGTAPAPGKLNALFASVAAAASLHQQVPLTTGMSPLYNPAAPVATVDAGLFTSPGFTASITTPLQQQGAWSQGLADQMMFMLQGKFQTAEMKLNPAHLGPMEIRLSMQDDQASVTFITQHAAVREALDVAMPRLRDMFESQGLHLANADVSQQSEQQGKSSGSLADGAGHGQNDQARGDQAQEDIQPAIIQLQGHAGLSLYA